MRIETSRINSVPKEVLKKNKVMNQTKVGKEKTQQEVFK